MTRRTWAIAALVWLLRHFPYSGSAGVEGLRCASAVLSTDRLAETSPARRTNVDEESSGTGG